VASTSVSSSGVATFDERGQASSLAIFADQRNVTTNQSFQRHSCGRANADGAATQMKRKPSPAGVARLFGPRQVRRQKLRKLDEPGPDELLDDWMVSGPSVEPASSD